MGMLPSEILRAVDERLSKYDMTPEGGCSMAFNDKLSDFLRKCTERSQSTRRALKLDEGQLTGGEELKLLENIAQNISGITPRQLEVFELSVLPFSL